MSALRIATAAAVASIGLVAVGGAAGAAPEEGGVSSIPASGARGSTAVDPATRVAAITVPATTEAVPAAGAPAIPTWNGSFKYSGTTYPFTMVGGAPNHAGTATVPTSITGIKFVLANGAYTYPGNLVSTMKSSALFTNAKLLTGTTQYGDDVQRAEFAGIANSGYHMRLGSPTLESQITIRVPAGEGTVIHANDGVGYLAINVNWFTTQVNALAARAPAGSMPMFLAYETYMYQGSPSQAGIGGFHSAVTNSSGRHTYSYASWVTPDLYGSASGNLSAMSHEVAEWLNDPYVNNKVPRWSVAGEPQYGCSGYLEVGDPLVGHVATIGGLNFQDEAGFSWFARFSPSIGLNHTYSWLGTFKTASKSC